MDDITEKYNELREAIETADDLDPSVKSDMLDKLDDLEGLIDEVLDAQYKDDEFNDEEDEGCM